MKKVRVRLRPMVNQLNLPTVIKTTILPGDTIESLMIATQVGEIYYLRNGIIGTFLDIRSQILELGLVGGYDERGLLGLAFHPDFYYNGLFYLHYSVVGTQGPGALPEPFSPNPCNPDSLNLKWTDRENLYDHIDTVEEWKIQPGEYPRKQRTLLNLIRPFFNHNGVNSLNISPETGMLVFTNGDGGSAYDPFNLSQDDMEIAGKIIEIDIYKNTFTNQVPAVTRFDELPTSVQETLTVITKGVRNIPGISYQRINNQFIKYVGNVGQHLVESIFSFIHYKPLPVPQIIRTYKTNANLNQEGIVNLGWRGWEGSLPTPIMRSCNNNGNMDEKIIAYYEEAIKTSVLRLPPLTCYYHMDPRPDKFNGTALTGVQAYMGKEISDLTGCVVFTDFHQNGEAHAHNHQHIAKGILAYTQADMDCKLNDYSIIEIDYDFGSESAYYTCLGANRDQTRLYLGVYGSRNVTDQNQGTVFEVVP
ncbi:PQQ-dependent sugar dehydrogenase [Mobilitalea sibirica]|uniref:PQQ-dependent sugar dehydrogenase n=1 Tax=Mobilitalea sibirica TaxID=1462919 RepID=A0A8J7H775_9FIRM|nr:PQQ-dependent sugar dehydrogenase [Mobilitalea sibirica]MBH1940996.1 PQQ-dependent sugar dehydrogenase [Mobilitalea sibirica]